MPNSIDQNQCVAVRLSAYGRHVYREYMQVEIDRAGIERKRDHPDQRKPATAVQQTLELPFWEMMRIFGPATRSTTLLPIEEIEVASSFEEISRRKDHAAALEELRAVAAKIGLVDAYKAPESARARLNAWVKTHVPSRPTGPGWWWLGARPVKVESTAKGLVYAQANGRRKPVDLDADWRGPACMDPRVHTEPKRNDDEDIPF